MASSPKKRNVWRPRTLTDSAKKRYRREQNKAEIFKTKVYLGDQHERWLSKKEELGLTHVGLAKIWLDRFSTDSETESGSAPYSLQKKVSTPVNKLKYLPPPPDVSEISSALRYRCSSSSYKTLLTVISAINKQRRISWPKSQKKKTVCC